MRPYLRSLLYNIWKDNSDNKELGKIIAQFLNCSGELSDINWSLLSKTSDKLDYEEETEISETIRDHRIRFLGFENFRTFPENENGYPYGMMFTNSMDEVSSLYLVGRNGMGKSSIFSALELLYTNNVSNMELRGIPRNNRDIYLAYGLGWIKFPDEMGVSLWVDMTDKHNEQQIYLKQIKGICPPAMFCSELDIEKIENENRKNDQVLDQENLFNYILVQLGYDELFILEDVIEDILKRHETLRDTSTNESLLKEKEFKSVIGAAMSLYPAYGDSETEMHLSKYAKAENIDAFRALHENDLNGAQLFWKSVFLEQWEELERNLTMEQAKKKTPDLPGTMKPKNATDRDVQGPANEMMGVEFLFMRLQEMYRHLYKTFSSLASVDNFSRFSILRDLDDLRQKAKESANNPYEKEDNEMALRLRALQAELMKKKDELITDFKKYLGPFIEKTLSFYSEDYELFHVTEKHDSFGISISVVENGKELFRGDPAKYLNSFRYKLYCISLKIAMAFYYMKLNKCLLPIVIDDMFNASDFENAQAIEFFVNRIYETYQTVVGFKESLQLIVFTHDEVVLEAFRNGTSKHSDKMLRNITEKGMIDPATRFRCGRLFSYREAKKIHDLTMSSRKYYQLYMKL